MVSQATAEGATDDMRKVYGGIAIVALALGGAALGTALGTKNRFYAPFETDFELFNNATQTYVTEVRTLEPPMNVGVLSATPLLLIGVVYGFLCLFRRTLYTHVSRVLLGKSGLRWLVYALTGSATTMALSHFSGIKNIFVIMLLVTLTLMHYGFMWMFELRNVRFAVQGMLFTDGAGREVAVEDGRQAIESGIRAPLMRPYGAAAQQQYARNGVSMRQVSSSYRAQQQGIAAGNGEDDDEPISLSPATQLLPGQSPSSYEELRNAALASEARKLKRIAHVKAVWESFTMAMVSYAVVWTFLMLYWLYKITRAHAVVSWPEYAITPVAFVFSVMYIALEFAFYRQFYGPEPVVGLANHEKYHVIIQLFANTAFTALAVIGIATTKVAL